MTAPVPWPEGPPLESRRLRLRPGHIDDVPFLYELATQSETGWRWRYRGYIPTYDQFLHELPVGKLVQFVVEDKKEEMRVGIVDAYGTNAEDRNTWVAVGMAPRYARSGFGTEALLFFMNYLFTVWDFRKIYAEMPAFNYQNIQSGDGWFFRVEGCLREHHYYGGRWWDKYYLAAYRDEWMQNAAPLMKRLLPPRP